MRYAKFEIYMYSIEVQLSTFVGIIVHSMCRFVVVVGGVVLSPRYLFKSLGIY
jgi:hypothetical protein